MPVVRQLDARHLDLWMIHLEHERRRQVVVSPVPKLVVEAQAPTGSCGAIGDHRAADFELVALHLLVVVAGIPTPHGWVTKAEFSAERRRRCVRVHAVVAHVHMTELVDLIGRHRAGVGDGQVWLGGIHGHPVWRVRKNLPRPEWPKIA